MNYLIPVISLLHKPIREELIENNKSELDSILTQQVLISQLSNGISFSDTEEMDDYERVFIFKKLIQLKKDENEAKEKAIKEMQNKR